MIVVVQKGALQRVRAALQERGSWGHHVASELREGKQEVTREMGETLADVALEVVGLDVFGDEERRFQVFYLVRGRRDRRPRWYSLVDAKAEVRALKRRGFTAWVADDSGRFVPIPGARREPAWIE